MNSPSQSSALEKPLPNNAEAEGAILGGIVLDNSLITQAAWLVQPEDFYVPSHRRIFAVMIALFEKGSEINPILIGEELKKENALESVGGISFITNLTYGLPHSSNIDHYAKIVRGKRILRNLIKAASKITAECLEGEDEPEVIADNAERTIFEVVEIKVKQGFVPAKRIASDVLEKVQELEGKQQLVTGLSTGFTDLDTLTSGLQPADLIIVAARPSQGKTSLALMLAENAAIRGEAVVGIFSLEMSKEALVSRMICSEAQVDSMRFRKGWLAKNEWTRLASALGAISNARIFIDDTPGISTLEMRAKARRLAAEQKRLDLIIVDYLQLMQGTSRRTESRQQEVSQISRELKGLAKELSVPVVALSQLSRAPENRTDHRPQLADLRESGALEQDADVVAFIYQEWMRKKQEDVPEEKKNVAEIIVAKQRNGPTDTVELRFTPSTTRFDNLFKE